MIHSMRILVIVAVYPSLEKPYNMAFVHSRVLYYQQKSWQVQVLSFSAEQPYTFDGVTVNSEASLDVSTAYDLVIAHAPNLRHHVRWLITHARSWKKMLWILHGHEVIIHEYYHPAPYPWDKKNHRLKRFFKYLYDHIKVRILRFLISRWVLKKRLYLIFVSQVLRQAFLDCVHIPVTLLDQHSSIIHNNMYPGFHMQQHHPKDIWADFVTIRPLDDARCCIDLIVELANRFPHLRFDVYGQGDFFKYNKKPDNLRCYAYFLKQSDIPALLSHYRAALMPTKVDTQGVMSCEMATFGMPLLTSDLPVCKEMLSTFQRVRFFSLTSLTIDLDVFLSEVELTPVGDLSHFHDQHTILREIEVIQTFATK